MTKATPIPGRSRKRWNSIILAEIGAKSNSAKGTHLLNNNSEPIIISKTPTIGNNHVFCDTFSSVNIKDNIIKGHVFLSFESIAEASGFQYFTTDENNNVNAILGDSVSLENVSVLTAVSPYPVRYQLFRNGEMIDEKEDVYGYEYEINQRHGNYRIEARLKLNDQWYPWIFTNPIYVY